MDIERFGEIVGASVVHGTPVTPEQVAGTLTNAELLQALYERILVAGSVAVDSGTETIKSPETPTLTPESLLRSLDTALVTYSSFVDTINTARAEVKRLKKPAQLEVVDADIIHRDVEALLANKHLIAELQAEIDYFTANPEEGSPEAGFELVIVPEGLSATDERNIAHNLQGKIPSSYSRPCIRPANYNAKRTPEVTSKGYRLAFVPRHYNVPKCTTTNQTNWMNANNRRTTATKLQTATEVEAMAFINGLVDNKQLDNPDTRFNQTFFRQFDHASVRGYDPCVYVEDVGQISRGRSDVGYGDPTRALVVPKA